MGTHLNYMRAAATACTRITLQLLPHFNMQVARADMRIERAARPLLFAAGLAALPTHAEDLGKLWPACKG